MSIGSNIEWTDATWVVTTGCTEASSGCANCYARVMSKRIAGMAAADLVKGKDAGKKAAYSLSVRDDGRWSGIVTPIPEAVSEPLRWRTPRRIFVNSMSDLFWGTERDLAEARRRGVKDPKPVPFEFIDRVFAVMALCPQHTFQVLTKRPERMAEYLSSGAQRAGQIQLAGADWLNEARPWWEKKGESGLASKVADHRRLFGEWKTWPISNVWLGTSVENQATADERIPHLKRCPAAVNFLSVEPLIGPVDLHDAMYCPRLGPEDSYKKPLRKPISWIIVGGESGPHARPCDVAWVRSIVEQCKAAGMPVFCKQLGARPMSHDVNDVKCEGRSGAYLAELAEAPGPDPLGLEDRKGGDPAEWPADLRVREMP